MTGERRPPDLGAFRAALSALAGLPVAAVLIAIAYVTNAAVDAGVSTDVVIRPLIIAVIGTATLTAVVVAITRSAAIGGLVVVATVLLIIGGGVVGTLITRTHPLQAAIWVLLVSMAITVLARIVRRQWRRGMPGTGSINVFGLLMLGLVLGSAALTRTDPVPPADPPAADQRPGQARDMVLILLDGYPRADVLDRYFGYDNTPFLEALTDRGFEVAAEAGANYAWTELTLLSMLHMEHAVEINEFSERAGGERSQPWLRELTNQNPVFELVRAAGYDVVTIGTNIDHVTLRSADIALRPSGPSDFELHLLRSTALGGAVSLLDPASVSRSHRDEVLWGMETLERQASNPRGGRLLIAHVLSPHMPAVFEPDGSLRVVPFDHDFFDDFRALGGQTPDEWNTAFIGQLEFINARTLQAINVIVDGNPDADVVVMSDHGTGSQYRPDQPALNADERYSSLFAARTPGIPSPFADDQTPVNVFPRWLNARFGLALPEVPDTAFAGYLDLQPINLDR